MLPREKWCNLVHSGCSKVSYYQPKTQQFLGYNKSTTLQILCHIFSKINPDAHVSTKNEYNHILQGGPGAIAPESQGNVKNGCFSFPCNDVDSDSC